MKNMHSFVIFRLIIFFYILISIHPNNAFSQNRSTGDLINYIASPSSTNNGDGLFGSILNLEVTIYGNNGEFIIKKQDGTKFTSSGLMFLTCSSNGIQVKKDISRQVSFNINFNSCIDDTPMDFYASYEVDSTQVAWVGPIKVTPNKDNCPQFQWIEPNNNSFQFVPFLIKGNAFDLDKIKKVTIAFIDSYGTHYNLTAYNSSPDSAKLYIQNKVDPTFFGLNNGLITIGIYIVDTYDRIGCDSNNQPVSTVDIYWKVGKLEVTPQDSFITSGEKGGNFSPESKYYTLKNTGGTAINFSISNTKNWIDLSLSNGRLEPNASKSLKVSINNYANLLNAGEHNDKIQVKNTTNHIGDTEIPVFLTVNEKPGKLEVTPQETFFSSGEKGGDFSPKSKEYTLKNTGGTAINFSISNTKNWIDLSISNGSIEPNARISLKVSINNYANQLDAGEHNDNVQVNNTSNHQGDTQIPVYLTVDEKPGKLEVTPQETFISSGEKGGDFSPKSKEYTLKNTGGIAINISISNTKNWIDLSESNVRLEANSSTSIEVSINNYANQLDVGEHNDKVQVNNLTNHQGDTQITVNLTVNNKINEQTWYKDFDGDGYTDGVRIESTIQLEGYYSQTQLNNILLIDCDDNDPNVNPGAIEVCDNNKDDDCYNGDEQCNNIGGEIHLPVPFIPQVPPGNWTETANCGPVCFLMVDSYHNNSIPTVEDIRMIDDWLLNEFSLPINDYNGSTTTLAQLERLAEEYGEYEQSNVNIHRNWTIDDISNELTEGYPVIVAVRLNMSNVISGSNGHFMVVIGIDENYIYVNDPGRSLESGRGSNMDYDHETFLQSWQTQNNSCLTIHSEIEGGGDSGSGITDVGSGDLPIESDSTSVTNDSNPKSVTPTTTPIDDDNGGGGCFLSTLFSIYID